MNLPSFMDMAKVAEIGVLVLIVIQYFKSAIPEKLIPVISVLLGIALSFGYICNIPFSEWTPYLVFVTILTGVAGAIGADTAYSFVSGTKSTPISLPSRAQLNGGTKPVQTITPPPTK